MKHVRYGGCAWKQWTVVVTTAIDPRLVLSAGEHSTFCRSSAILLELGPASLRHVRAIEVLFDTCDHTRV